MTANPPPLPVPSDGLGLIRERVRAEWIDYNGHMNVAWYVAAFDMAGESFLEQVGLGPTAKGRLSGRGPTRRYAGVSGISSVGSAESA